MIIRVVSEEEYFRDFPRSRNVYGSRDFVRVTAPNAQAVRYLAAYDEQMKPRFGIVAGYRDGEWHAPYSAPFTEIAYNKPQQLERIYDFISELTEFLGAPLHVSLPPAYYDPEMLPKLIGMLGNYATSKVMDFDYYMPMSKMADYAELLDHATRKNLSRAQKAGFSFAKTSDIDRAYEVIRANRESHGYNLAMSLQQVKDTAEVVDVDFFVMSLAEADVAAAMVYHVADSIAQVIYWGDAPGYAHLRPMNLLPLQVFSYYHNLGYKIVDVGPSSTQGIPNSGLCRFKESIGCMTEIKHSFVFR